ncbi:metallophosphoesterase [Halorubrum ezzemoulense]|uniref:metallophosphoesterase n=1 Tax=Halorubrum ezzemoulense TaxID=337243 RepID=UPI00232C713B|nr:metallophosphoesterase [Halorubrum ezzemoulense]MDB2253066.1 metallophosphoesterase [Halorubrum ezzemoulense]
MDYLISDLHLNHDNIIDYCDRPFGSVEEMNETLVEHWNDSIDPGDEVLYGGDLTIRSSAAALLDWLDELNGEIVFLLGNHDGTVLEEFDSSTSSNSSTVEFRSMLSMTQRTDPQIPRDGCSTVTITITGQINSPSSTTTPSVSISPSSCWTISP